MLYGHLQVTQYTRLIKVFNTDGSESTVAMIASQWGRGRRLWAGGWAAILLGAALAGCSQTAPTPGAIARSDFVDAGQPLVLTGGAPPAAAATEAKPKEQAALEPAPTGKKAKSAPTPASKPATSEPASSDATRDVAPPEPAQPAVVAVPDSSGSDARPEPQPAAALALPDDGATPDAAGAQTAGEYPNINTPPAQPEGKLLSPDERKKLIMKLNALARRPTGNTTASGKPCPEGATEAECKAAIE